MKLADWEVRHPIIHPGMLIKSTDVVTFISSQTDKIVDAQLRAADKIVVSQERIKTGIDRIAFGIEMIHNGLAGLGAVFEWGFSQLVWQFEQERKILKQILEVLQAPLDTQAKELRRRAEEAYKNGWIEDALQDFLEAENKNRYDFTIHISLGHIYLFEKKNIEKALEYYEKAVKYATPKSSYYTSYALLHIGLIKYLQDNFKEAYESALKAVTLSPNLYEGYFQCAQYCAKLGLYNDAIHYLSKAIEGDKYYCVKVYSEKDFDVMREQIKRFFEKLQENAKIKAEREIDKAEELLKKLISYYGVESYALEKAVNELDKAKEFLRRESLFDCWDAILKARSAQKMAVEPSIKYLSDQISIIEDHIYKIRDEYNSYVKRCKEKVDGMTENLEGITFFLFIFPPIFPFIFGALTGSIVIGVLTWLFGWVVSLYFPRKLVNIWSERCIRKYEEACEAKMTIPKSKLSELQTKNEELKKIEILDEKEKEIVKNCLDDLRKVKAI